MFINRSCFRIIQNTIRWTWEHCTSPSLSSKRSQFFNLSPGCSLGNRSIQDVVEHNRDVIACISSSITLKERMYFCSMNKFFYAFLKKPTALLAITTFDKLVERLKFAVDNNLRVSYQNISDRVSFVFNDINELNKGYTAFHRAITHKNKEIATLLLENGANVSAQDCFGCTALHNTFWGDQAMVTFLLTNGINTEVKADGDYGRTALHRAIKIDDQAIATLLLQNGANVNAQDDFGYTPLHLAVNTVNAMMCTLLLQNGADVNVQDAAGNTPLALAIENEDIVTLLSQYANR